MNRNSLCSCGSGKRFKHCCGSPAVAAPPTRLEALAAHRVGQLGRAETLYGRALEQNPGDVDSRHMLGVVQMQRMRYREALDLLWEAAEQTGWSVDPIRHNLGLVLGKLMAREANNQQADLLAAFVEWNDARCQSGGDLSPLVSVVMPAYNHARYVAQAIASVAAQSYTNLELVIIDDGSRDGTPEVIAEAVRDLPFPVSFVARENRGAPATLNEAAQQARGKYVAFLNSDDYFAPDRITRLVEEIAAKGARWGFSLATTAGDAAEPNAAASRTPLDVMQKQRNFLGRHPTSFTFVEYNVAVSSGNLFVEREFFLALNGFRKFRYNHDWDFCLRAAALAEPVIVHQPLYFYRIHAGNTISESDQAAKEDARLVFTDFLAAVLGGTAACTNPIGPYWPESRGLLLKLVFGAGQGALVPIPILQSLAARWRADPLPLPSSALRGAVPIPLQARKTAVVVLGMHRSGTSALARVLNLCGAALPAKLKPPKLDVNPKGFWESEAVLDLNVRLMGQLGGDWNQVAFALPAKGDIVDEFQSDARALLAAEYGEQQTILIKDPRICVLAPLWHQALVASGYLPVYVIPVRNPLEVAQSLHARGDMSVSEGLALWLAYMRRVEEFAQAHPAVMRVRFTDLLDDWRSVVGRIASRFDIPLDAGKSAQAVDTFLEQGLRRQTVHDDSLDALPAGAVAAEIRSLYLSNLARCVNDAVSAQPSRVAMGSRTDETRHRPVVPPPTVSFVLCIEGNAIREQALMLCESIRQFAGIYSRAPILAFAPRPGLGVDAPTRRLLTRMDVEYIDQPLNTTCPQYGSANRVFSSVYAEQHAATDFLVVLDSDTVWLDQPFIPTEADVAVRPVDSKGSATRGPGDRFEDYWAGLAQMAGISLDRLPPMRTTVGNEHIRASYNGGLTVVRRNMGILTRCAELFAASVKAGMLPYRGSGIDILASTGQVGLGGSEYWGSCQAALTLAIWAATDRVLLYPDSYNVPLHLVADAGDIDPRWLESPPVHLHYHYMFSERHHEVAMDLLTRLAVSPLHREWLARRTPLRTVGDKSRDTHIARSPS